MCPDDHQRRVWKRPRKRADPAFPIARHVRPQPGVMLANARSHTARVAMNSLTACQTLPWPARAPDLSQIEHVWDMMGRRLHRLGQGWRTFLGQRAIFSKKNV
ncbi:transposable element Tc1 transposase [Trichonephila clavipes]|nr:transposable element Tc1 transposase [Trichonephila clavipes]